MTFYTFILELNFWQWCGLLFLVAIGGETIINCVKYFVRGEK